MKLANLKRLVIYQALIAVIAALPSFAQADAVRIQRGALDKSTGTDPAKGSPSTPAGSKPAAAKTSTAPGSPSQAATAKISTAPGSTSQAATAKTSVAKAALPKSPTGGKPSTSAKSAALERGIYLSKHGAYSDAFNFFTKAADAEPKNPEPYNRRARVEWQLGKNAEALEDARYAISLNPDYAEAFCTRAAILNSTGNYHDAIVDAALAAELKPKLKEAYTLRASAYRNLKQYHEADDIMQKLAGIPDPVSAFEEWAPNIDYTQYVTDLQNKVRSNWKAPQGVYPPIVVLFKLHRDGSVSDVRTNSVGVAVADSAAVEAAKNSAPFNQPPAGSPPDFDVFVVLDPPTEEANAQIDAAQTASVQQAAAPPPTPSTPKAGINWGTTINTGLNLIRFIPMRF